MATVKSAIGLVTSVGGTVGALLQAFLWEWGAAVLAAFSFVLLVVAAKIAVRGASELHVSSQRLAEAGNDATEAMGRLRDEHAEVTSKLRHEHSEELRKLHEERDAIRRKHDAARSLLSGAAWPAGAALEIMLPSRDENTLIVRDGEADVSFALRFVNRAPFAVTVRQVRTTWRIECGDDEIAEGERDELTGAEPLQPGHESERRLTSRRPRKKAPVSRLGVLEVACRVVVQSAEWDGDKAVEWKQRAWIALHAEGVR